MDKLNGADNSVLKMCAGNLLETIDRCAERSAAYQRTLTNSSTKVFIPYNTLFRQFIDDEAAVDDATYESDENIKDVNSDHFF